MNPRPQEFHYKTGVPLRFADMDTFGHVNNAVYLTYFEMARSCYLKDIIQWNWEETGMIIGRAEINYLKPICLNDEVFAYVRISRIGNSSFDMDYALVKIQNGDEILCTTGTSVCVTFDYTHNRSASIPETYRFRMQEFEALAV